MEEKTKQRLIGLLVLLGTLFIILPFLFHNEHPSLNTNSASNAGSPQTVSLPLNSNNNQNVAQNTENNNTTTVANNNNPSNVANTATTANEDNANATATAANANNNAVAVNNAPNENEDTNNPATGQAATAQAATAQAAPQTAAAPAATMAPNTPSQNSGMDANSNASNPAASNAAVSAAPATNAVVTAQAAQPAATVASPNLLGSAPAVTTGKQNPPFQQQVNPAAQDDTAVANNVEPQSDMQNVSAAPMHNTVKQIRQAQVTRGFSVQLAVFSEKPNAHALMQKLRQHHFKAYSRDIVRSQMQLTAVFVGPETSMQQAENMKNTLQRDFHLNGVVKKYAA